MRMDSGLNLRLKEARELRGWTVEKAANLCGVTARTFVDWEAGKKAPRVSRLITLAGVLGVAVTWLINGDDDLDPHESNVSRLDKLASRLEMAVNRSRNPRRARCRSTQSDDELDATPRATSAPWRSRTRSSMPGRAGSRSRQLRSWAP